MLGLVSPRELRFFYLEKIFDFKVGYVVFDALKRTSRQLPKHRWRNEPPTVKPAKNFVVPIDRLQ